MAGLNIVKLLESVDLQSTTAHKDWEIFEGDFENYLIATGQDECPDKALLRMENATLAKVAAHCRLVQQSQEQAKDIQPKNYVQVRSNASVDFVAAKSR
ncbi:hypothetical protein PR048_015098 [Dryococelus australis]|uniref:Uncharacterized protein n=1 Tax=Dryococelus australis TaxID=614101 RepID=A0ABQ9HG16_9NEOP|nr:hypothetical protein PR048_015098 [Dryococelus australis]